MRRACRLSASGSSMRNLIHPAAPGSDSEGLIQRNALAGHEQLDGA